LVWTPIPPPDYGRVGDPLFKVVNLPVGAELFGEISFAGDTDGLYASQTLSALLNAERIGSKQHLGYGQCKFILTNRSSLSRVFLSYSWEEDFHINWVFNLAKQLNSDGIYVIHDRSFMDFDRDLTPSQIEQFMVDSVRKADKLLVILSPEYKRKAEGIKGGVGFEFALMKTEPPVHSSLERDVALLRKGDPATAIPLGFERVFVLDMREDPVPDDRYRMLVERIRGGHFARC
jgi:hypothetical protein